jgi:hypothetical protein
LFIKLLVFLSLAGAATTVLAQAKPTATRSADLQIGGGFTTANSDYLPTRINGGTAYVDYDFIHHIGIEGEFHFVKDGSGSEIYEKTYELGGRYHRTYGRFSPYAKGMYGRGVFNFPAFPGFRHANLAYNLIAVGGGVDYRVLKHLNARADFEYQRWFGFPQNGLAPTMFTIGAAYHF